MSFIYNRLFQFSARRSLSSLSSFSPLNAVSCRPSVFQAAAPMAAERSSQGSSPLFSALFGFTQRRWKSRGNTYQPSTLKRKRRVGFLARAKSKQGYKVLKRRREKGRWYLTH
ncbi:mitochondrial 54S ribosomal protein bL34m [Lachancea thermotolerans CBS 6340]|uniref:Large ribosomal subunit protein bL34m n=1 Tax=Lachancea thermotolerans (strain ATCC 56472 / CBS 6340 / NRRL Y-8284) TaxID=559295 RepID=C5DN24_LACTC|nr:putative mitochondrial 54S ribosomal protein [Lachancea thermotolerans CBS 6340]CAR25185.1 KLTH0G13574p [Lachancea thermotolerans CBS 6340]